MKKYYFISGLPRSGSTLLSAILKQNPHFHAGISTNLLHIVRNLIESTNDGTIEDFDEYRTKRIIASAVDAYYADIECPVIFDTNRLWTNLLPQLKDLYPYTKILCCVRDINWIIDSFERLHQNNPYSISTVFPKDKDFNVYERAHFLMNASGGIIKSPYDCIKSAISGMHKDMIMIIDYEILCQQPEGVMRAIYNFLELDYFEHNFNNVESSYDEYDKTVRLKNLHRTYKRVEWRPRETVLPPDLINEYKDLEIWK